MKRKSYPPAGEKAEGRRLPVLRSSAATEGGKAEVSQFGQKTGYCPLYLAWRILDEARDYFRIPILWPPKAVPS